MLQPAVSNQQIAQELVFLEHQISLLQLEASMLVAEHLAELPMSVASCSSPFMGRWREAPEGPNQQLARSTQGVCRGAVRWGDQSPPLLEHGRRRPPADQSRRP